MTECADKSVGNVYVDLDQGLPSLLRLRSGQTLIFVREIAMASGPVLESLQMPKPYFIAVDLKHGFQIKDQPEGTYLVAAALVSEVGRGEILIQFRPQADDLCASATLPLVRLPFQINE